MAQTKDAYSYIDVTRFSSMAGISTIAIHLIYYLACKRKRNTTAKNKAEGKKKLFKKSK